MSIIRRLSVSNFDHLLAVLVHFGSIQSSMWLHPGLDLELLSISQWESGPVNASSVKNKVLVHSVSALLEIKVQPSWANLDTSFVPVDKLSSSELELLGVLVSPGSDDKILSTCPAYSLS